ncbi:DNA metabolism protein [Halarcobacter ebronensis]|uniref:DNA metabolism protein n=1 Tax=Halarcobacter ebronensis TaxID=1462615 RepID=A0A4Q0YBG6_9BACT|nr:TIGR03915 family putative DNA repair protein [Halarcobacter ebronensis]RXJ66419.1 DNA metabolism protein [Halarcobacter ebronensis]
MILLYDRTFEGFLTLVYEVYYKKLKPTAILKEKPTTLILEELIEIRSDELKAKKVLSAIKNSFPKTSFELILNSFLCDKAEFELYLLRYIILGFKNRDELFNINIKEVFYLQNLEKELLRNLHKMYGFVRFSELEDGILYAKLESNFNLSYLLGKHFFKRLNNQNFIIHDINRELAFIKDKLEIKIERVVEFNEPNYSKGEEKFTKLWNRFFSATTIKSRTNKKCQQNLVPLIYRTYMTEFI